MPLTRLAPPIAACALLLGMLLASPVMPARAAGPVADTRAVEDITALLRDFLAKVDQAATHDRFWADDLVYTSGAGAVKDKAAIMKSFEAEPEAAKSTGPAGSPARYDAEDILVRPFGDSAALTFRLVAHAADGTRSHFRNSGMFVRRNGAWQVVTWQATPEPAVPAQ